MPVLATHCQGLLVCAREARPHLEDDTVVVFFFTNPTSYILIVPTCIPTHTGLSGLTALSAAFSQPEAESGTAWCIAPEACAVRFNTWLCYYVEALPISPNADPVIQGQGPFVTRRARYSSSGSEGHVVRPTGTPLHRSSNVGHQRRSIEGTVAFAAPSTGQSAWQAGLRDF